MTERQNAGEATSRGLSVPQDLRAVSVDGRTLAYRELGAGDPVVFVHGGISDLTIWGAQLPVVGSRRRAIAYSRRYAWPNEDLSTGGRDTMKPVRLPLGAAALESLGADLAGEVTQDRICRRFVQLL